jgi:hypothetical protein
MLADVPLEDSWGGPIDISPIHLPFFGSLTPGNIHYAVGYSGNGVAPTFVAGQIMAALAVGGYEEMGKLALVDARLKRFPLEPMRSIGVFLLRQAILKKDNAEDVGERPDPMADFVARLPRRMGYHLGPG